MHGTCGRIRIVVVGSVNIDLVAVAHHIPSPGETVLGRSFDTIAGGKGANQAVAAARLGSRVAFVGRVGDDDFAVSLRATLEKAGVECRHLLKTPDVASGAALIVVSLSGENAICVAAGANGRLSPHDIDAAEALIAAARVCILQLEIPLETALHTIAVARRHGVETILDPAPAPANAPPELFDVDILTPNRNEAAQMLRGSPAREDPADRAAALLDRGARAVVLTLGAAGAYLLDQRGGQRVGGHAVRVVDTTGAGDAFAAALAVARVESKPLSEAVRFANAAGAAACTRLGAQPAMPTRGEVEALLAR